MIHTHTHRPYKLYVHIHACVHTHAEVLHVINLHTKFLSLSTCSQGSIKQSCSYFSSTSSNHTTVLDSDHSCNWKK